MPNATTASDPGLSPIALAELEAICPGRTLSRWIDRIAYASDASFYHLVPQAVLQPQNRDEIRQLFGWSQAHRVPITFRTAGTSLSGQAVGDGLLVDLSKHWREVEVLEQGAAIRVQPGVIGAHANALLRPFGRKIGPDPASIQACMLGGILANNASGMCCGVSQNAYHTLRSLALMLPNGQYFDTAKPGAGADFVARCPEIATELSALRAEILANPTLCASIRHKYRQKNTTGYSLNALLDFEDPLLILAHLLIGSEGTLALIAEAVLDTVVDKAYKYTGLLCFAKLTEACAWVQALAESGAAAIELLDEASLRALPTALLDPWLAAVPPGACALLVEYQAADPAEHALQIQAADSLLQRLPLLVPGRFSLEAAEQALLWKLRKGLYPSIGAARVSGSTVLIEDVVFPLAQLAEAIEGLHTLFARHGYHEAIIFGHARDGNLHFVLTQSFNTASETSRYDAFMQELVSMVLALGGALKAEHGTGRNMAPFVVAEWGPEAYEIMMRLKAALDPHQLLNPGVILNPSPSAHLEDLKALPSVDREVDRCTECGFCEPVCPSRRLTLTPRQRIVIRREMQRLAARGESLTLEKLNQDYQYAGLDTCATDSLCSLACPIGIDTGSLVKRLRAEAMPETVQRQVSRLSRG
ncbi:MAG: FAD-binding oxidoreductase, partial [Candidatus Melainabacteria bacterium HGW-Melainabacteria-1]